MEKYAKERDAFVLDCGDIVGNTPNLYLDYILVSGGLGLPVYRIIGNHDMEIGVRSFEHSYTVSYTHLLISDGEAQRIGPGNCLTKTQGCAK